MATKLIKLTDGILIEVEAPPDQPQQIAGGVADKVKTGLDKIQPILTAVCRPLVAAWQELDRELDVEKASVALGVSFEGEGNLFVTKSTAGANLTITLELKRPVAPEAHWGHQVVALIEAMRPTEWAAMDIPDVVAWVKEQRRKAAERRGVVYWDQGRTTGLSQPEVITNQ